MSAVYQSLNSIIDNVYLETLSEDSYLSNSPRYMIQRFARLGLKELSLKGQSPTVKALRLAVNDSNGVTLPRDYIKYLRVSWINEIGDLIPIGVNNSISTANQYLLDHLDNILLDNNDIELLGSGDQDIDREALRFDYSTSPFFGDPHFYDGRYLNNSVNINQTFKGGVEFKEDKINDKIQFAGTKLETVVLEYLYDPFKNVGDVEELEVNQMFGYALEKWIYHEMISNKRSVPDREKYRAEKALKKALLEARISNNIPVLLDIVKMTNG